MYKSKLVKLCVILAVTGCMMTGCGDKKEETVANTTTVESSADATKEETTQETSSANGKTEIGDDVQGIIDECLADEYSCYPSSIMVAMEDAGYDYDFAEKYVESLDIDWLKYAKIYADNDVHGSYHSEYTVRTTMENSCYFDKDIVDQALNELNIDFGEVCYDYMYWKCSGRYPEDESEIEAMKQSCTNSHFTDSQIEYAVNKLAENCR